MCQGPTTRQTPLISTRGTICKASQCPKLISDSQLVPTHVNIIDWMLEIYFVRKRRASLLQQLYFGVKNTQSKETLEKYVRKIL